MIRQRREHDATGKPGRRSGRGRGARRSVRILVRSVCRAGGVIGSADVRSDDEHLTRSRAAGSGGFHRLMPFAGHADGIFVCPPAPKPLSPLSRRPLLLGRRLFIFFIPRPDEKARSAAAHFPPGLVIDLGNTQSIPCDQSLAWRKLFSLLGHAFSSGRSMFSFHFRFTPYHIRR